MPSKLLRWKLPGCVFGQRSCQVDESGEGVRVVDDSLAVVFAPGRGRQELNVEVDLRDRVGIPRGTGYGVAIAVSSELLEELEVREQVDEPPDGDPVLLA